MQNNRDILRPLRTLLVAARLAYLLPWLQGLRAHANPRGRATPGNA